MLSSGAVHAQAAEPTVAELQAEIARLRQALANQSAAAAAPGTAPAANSTSAVSTPAANGNEPAATAEAPKEQELETVVVRSRNRLERVQDVPLSVSVIGGRELERELAFDIGAITKRAANVVRNTGNSRTYSLSIRGVGKVSQTEAQDASVGVILDGVNFAYAPLSSFDFYDVESVEVARGPQGTLLGKNTTMGVINVTTRRPSFTPDASWSLTLGQRKTVLAQFAGGGPVIDDLLAFRGSLLVNKGAGPYKNAYNPDETYFNRDRVAGRVQFLLTPTPDFSARASVEIQPKGGEYYNGLTVKTDVPAFNAAGAPTFDTSNDIRSKLARDWFARTGYTYEGDYLGKGFPNNDNQRALQTSTNGASLELKWNIGSHDLTSITAYRDYHFHARNDSEATPFDISKNGGGKNDAYRQRSQEFRVASKAGGTFDYQVGALLFENTVDFGQQGWNAGWGADAGAWFANNAQYATLSTTAAGRLLLSDSLNGLNKASTQSVRNRSFGIYAQGDWKATDDLTVTTGVRFTRENRKNEGSNYLVSNGYGGALNPVFSTGPASEPRLALGGFDSNAQGVLAPSNTAEQLALADQVAQRYFGKASYTLLDTTEQRQVAAAKSLRSSQIGRLWALTQSEAFRKTQPSFTFSPSYKLNDDQTAYFTAQYGEKGGVSQLVNGKSYLAKPEKVTSLETGLKSALLDKTLFINADIFYTQVKDYQQLVVEIDPNNAANNTQYTGNAPKVNIHGLEIDGSYTGLKNTTLRFSGAYTVAKFKEFPNSPLPAEGGPPGATMADLSGQTLTGAAKYTFNLGAEYRLPVWNDKVFHTSFNTAFTSKINSDGALSSYAWIPKNTKTDFSIGLGRRDQAFDFSVIVKNLFGDDTPQNRTWTNYVPADPRWIGFQVSGKL
ncbi:MAG: TonB-dependent receptor [Rubrivivax sp.]|nr:MAG: TonB-dependent receptor [Rubrivivax sp.]